MTHSSTIALPELHERRVNTPRFLNEGWRRRRRGSVHRREPGSGVRARLIQDVFSAHQGVEDDAMNLFCLGGNVIGAGLAWELIATVLVAHFSGAPRRRRRLAIVQAFEKREAIR